VSWAGFLGKLDSLRDNWQKYFPRYLFFNYNLLSSDKVLDVLERFYIRNNEVIDVLNILFEAFGIKKIPFMYSDVPYVYVPSSGEVVFAFYDMYLNYSLFIVFDFHLRSVKLIWNGNLISSVSMGNDFDDFYAFVKGLYAQLVGEFLTDVMYRRLYKDIMSMFDEIENESLRRFFKDFFDGLLNF
jgi:hypothetical protein